MKISNPNAKNSQRQQLKIRKYFTNKTKLSTTYIKMLLSFHYI